MVLFSLECVILFMGVCLFPACVTSHMTKGRLPPGGVCIQGGGVCTKAPPPRYGQQVASTHPTGMHTCLLDVRFRNLRPCLHVTFYSLFLPAAVLIFFTYINVLYEKFENVPCQLGLTRIMSLTVMVIMLICIFYWNE